MRRELWLLASRPNSRKVRSSTLRLAGATVELGVVGYPLNAIPFQEVNEGGVGGDWHSHNWFVGRVASLVAFSFPDELPNLPRWSVDN
jgi:hypothetical protein